MARTPDADGSRARRSGLTRQDVLAAALRLIDADGVDALSMRRLGRALDRDPMRLYRYAASKDELLDAVVELVLSELEVSSPTADDWEDVLRRTARSFRGIALAHPRVVPLLVTRPLATPLALRPIGTLRPLEAVLDLLVGAGFTARDALHAYRLYMGFLQDTCSTSCRSGCSTPTRPTTCCGWACIGSRPATGQDLLVRGNGRASHAVISTRTVVCMGERVDNRVEVREFLTSRRARVTQEQAGLPTFGGSRRVKGLRRGEVAQLAGVSVEYYTRLERGNLQGVSESVLDAVARALLLDDAERAHLFDLARAANASPRSRRRTVPQRVRPGIERVVEAITAPAWVRNGRSDFMASNRLARALYAPVFSQDRGSRGPVRPANTARFAFLDPRARDFYVDWERTASDIVAVLRAEAGRDPYDRGLTDLVGELSTRSEDFRTRWAAHDVLFHRTGSKRLRHPVVGALDLTYEAMEFPSDPGLTLLVYTAEPSSPTADALALLASWAATVDREEQADQEQRAAPAPDGA